MSSQFVIRLEDLRFYSKIGVFEQERTVGNDFSLDICVTIDAANFKSEDLESTISYAELYGIASCEMNKEWLLIESVTKSISDRIKSRWGNILDIKVKITKHHPPINGIEGKASVEYLNS